eukprot:m.123236 g.123236  ORF g.123236 m.123236 type:complete len:416 (+) comp37816_c0_seq7:22-1269(+)
MAPLLRLFYPTLILMSSVKCLPIDFSRCTFETDACNWEDAKVQGPAITAISIRRMSAFNHASNLSSDHTFPASANGSYLLFSPPKNSSGLLFQKGQLRGPAMVPQDGVCGVKFAYFSAGVFDSNFSVSLSGVRLKQLTNTTGQWTVDVVEFDVVSPMPSFVEFQLDARPGDFTYKVALDDLQFLPCSLCTFERGTCSWQTPGSYSWTRRQGKPSTIDHSLGNSNGHYVSTKIFEKTNIVQRQLIGMVMIYDDNICSAGFWYYLNGTAARALHVLTHLPDHNGGNKQYSIMDKSNGEWKYSELYLPWASYPRNFRLQVVLQTDFTTGDGNIAVDDLQYFRCAGADECTFEDSLCSWRNYHNDSARLSWKLDNDGLFVDFPSRLSRTVKPVLKGQEIGLFDNICGVQISYSVHPHGV